MLNTLTLLALAASGVTAWRSRSRWNAYHRAEISRAQLTNSLFASGGTAAGAAVLVLLRLFGVSF